MELRNFQEQVFFSTVRITIPNESGTGASIGTGFIFSKLLNESDGTTVILLLSTRHVFGDPSKPILLNFHQKEDDGEGPKLGKISRLQSNEFSGIFEGHPNPDIDLACINISMIANPKLNIFYKNLAPEMIYDFTGDQIFPGSDVWFVGYPENRFDTVHNLPILRRGYIASIPKVDFNAKGQFVIDAQVFPGSSGSPVFCSIGRKFKLIGIVTETMIKNEILQMVPTQTAPGFHQFLGLGLVIKVNFVKELIDHVVNKINQNIAENKNESVIEGKNGSPRNGA